MVQCLARLRLIKASVPPSNVVPNPQSRMVRGLAAPLGYIFTVATLVSGYNASVEASGVHLCMWSIPCRQAALAMHLRSAGRLVSTEGRGSEYHCLQVGSLPCCLAAADSQCLRPLETGENLHRCGLLVHPNAQAGLLPSLLPAAAGFKLQHFPFVFRVHTATSAVFISFQCAGGLAAQPAARNHNVGQWALWGGILCHLPAAGVPVSGTLFNLN